MTTTAAVEALLAAFFGDGNDLTPAALTTDAPELANWLDERLARLRQDPGASHVLPRRVTGKTKWYGLAHSHRQLSQLAQTVEALMVPTYAQIRRSALDGADPVEAAVLQFTGGHAVVLDVVAGQQKQVRRAFELLTSLEAQRPRRELSLARPLGRLLREFEMAVLAAAEGTSEELLREIEQTGHLSAQNVVFLRVRRLAGLRRFDELLQLPELTTLLAVRRPARVSASLLEAVYVTQLAGYEADNDAAGALRQFNDVVLRRYPALFKSRHGLQTASAIKTFMLHSLVLRPQDAAGRAQLVSSPDLGPEDRRFLRELADLVDAPQPQERTLSEAATAARSGDFDTALDIASGQPTSVERAELLIRCAYEIDSLAAMSTAKAAVEMLAVDQRDALVSSRWYATPWTHITEALSGEIPHPAAEVPNSWSEWFRRVVEVGPFPNAIEIAERAVVEWSAADFTSEDGLAVAGLLNQDLAPQAMPLIKDTLPYFLQFLDRADPARHRQLLDDLAVLILAEDELGVADVQVLVNLAATLIELGLSADRYRQLVADVRDLWERVDSPAHLDAAIDMLDVLLTFGAPDPGARDSLFQMVLASFQRWRRRVRSDQWTLLADLASELGFSDAVAGVRPAGDDPDDAVTGPSRDALAGKTIAIYTLTDPAGERARDFIQRNFDDVVVKLSSDHVASDRLRSLARSADVFIIATRSAKHAATTFIETQRPSERPLLFASGKGSASLIRALFQYVSP